MMIEPEELHTLLQHQRAHREFAEKEVPWSVVRRVLSAATRAPSAENRQPWRFVVCQDPSVRAGIAELTRRVWEGGAADHAREHLSDDFYREVEAGATGGLASAPLLVVVAVDTEAAAPGPSGPSVWPAVQNLLLAATAEGLGSALTTLAAQVPEQLRALVELPSSYDPVAIIPLGWPTRPLGRNRRDPVDEVAWLDTVGRDLPES